MLLNCTLSFQRENWHWCYSTLFQYNCISKHTVPGSVKYQQNMVVHWDSYLKYELLPNILPNSNHSVQPGKYFWGIHNTAARETQAVKSGLVSCVLNSPKSGSAYIRPGLSSSWSGQRKGKIVEFEQGCYYTHPSETVRSKVLDLQILTVRWSTDFGTRHFLDSL